MHDSLIMKKSFNFNLIHRQIHHSYLVSKCANQHTCIQNSNHPYGIEHTASDSYVPLKIKLWVNVRAKNEFISIYIGLPIQKLINIIIET